MYFSYMCVFCVFATIFVLFSVFYYDRMSLSCRFGFLFIMSFLQLFSIFRSYFRLCILSLTLSVRFSTIRLELCWLILVRFDGFSQAPAYACISSYVQRSLYQSFWSLLGRLSILVLHMSAFKSFGILNIINNR